MSMRRGTPNLDALVHSTGATTGGAEGAVGGRGCVQADATTANTSERCIAEW
jgi:hypothetical protein